MHKSYHWVIKVIESCTDEFQLNCCKVLINLFQNKYEDGELSTNLHDMYLLKEEKLKIKA